MMMGCDVLRLVHPEDREPVAARLRLVLQESRIALGRYFRVLRLDGQSVDVEMAGARIEFQGRTSMQLVLRDITERKHIEECLVQMLAVQMRGTVQTGPGPGTEFQVNFNV